MASEREVQAAAESFHDNSGAMKEWHEISELERVFLRDSAAAALTAAERVREDEARKAKAARLIWGCNVDLEDGEKPNGCVIDEGRPQDCNLARRRRKKETCPHWRQYDPSDYTRKEP